MAATQHAIEEFRYQEDDMKVTEKFKGISTFSKAALPTNKGEMEVE
jgi:hypothetical protein